MIAIYEQFNKVNAPSFIYWILTGTRKQIMGHACNHKQKLIDSINIDKDVPDKSIKELLLINDIELRASCQGCNIESPTYLIFRTINQDEFYIKQLIKRLSIYPELKAGYDIGNSGQIRIGIAGPGIWYKQDSKKFNEWWLSLPKKIKDALT